MRKTFLFIFFMALILFINKIAFAKPTVEQLMERMAQMDARIQELENRLAAYEGSEQRHEAKVNEVEEKIEKFEVTLEEVKISSGIIPALEGIEIGAGATFVCQFTDNANGDNLSQGDEDVTDASYSIDLEFEKKFEDYGMAFIHLETGDGVGVEDELKVFSNVNRDADDSDNSISLTEVWYEHYFQSIPLSLMIGKIDGTVLVDTNEYANDECTQFLGRIFRNSPTIELPDNSIGVRANLALIGFTEFDMLLMDADGDWEDIGDDVFFATQINLKPNFLGRDGSCRFIGWLNNCNHTKWDDASKTQERGYGFGVSFDQELTDILGAFARYGWQAPDIYMSGSDFSLEHAYSLGLQLRGSPWGREDDILACAFGQIFPSDDYKKANNLKANAEEHIEVYYNLKINDHVTISPDLQVSWDPYGGDATNGDNTIIVGGLRTQVDF